MVLSYLLVFNYAVLGLILKPWLVHKIADYSWKSMGEVYLKCLKVTLIIAMLVLGIELLNDGTLVTYIIEGLLAVVICVIVIWLLGLTVEEKKMVLDILGRKLGIEKQG